MKIPVISKLLEKRKRIRKQRELEITRQEFEKLPRHIRKRVHTRLKQMQKKGQI